MKFRRTKSFKRDFERLPLEVQEIARQKFRLFKSNPSYPYHPSLRIKPLRGFKNVMEGHLTMGYVFTFHTETDPDDGALIFVFRRIGRHDVYKKP